MKTELTRIGAAFMLVGALALVGAASASAQEPQQKPNVVFILADNVGYGDLGPYGGGELRGAPTPRIDQLAREGLRLTQYLVEPGLHAVARGADDRAILDPQRSVADHRARHDSTLSARAFTMGEMFKGAGYATAIFGKWHLGDASRRACRRRTASTSSTAFRRISPGRLDLRRHDRAYALDPCAARDAAGQGAADR